MSIHYVELLGDNSTYAPLWTQWYNSSGKKGEKPPTEYLRITELWEEMLGILDLKVHEENWNEIRRILSEQLFIIPIVQGGPGPLVFSKGLGNVAHSGMQMAAARAAEQMFFKD